MTRSMSRSIIAILSLGLLLLLPAGALAQSEPSDEPVPIAVPEVEGLAWHRSIDLTGPEIRAERGADEVAEWGAMLDEAGGTFEQLEYTFQTAFDPSTLPVLGGLATVRVQGASTDALLEAVVQDILVQVAKLEEDIPEPRAVSIGGRDVTAIELPDGMGSDVAIVYASGDVAWVFLMPEDLAALALAALP